MGLQISIRESGDVTILDLRGRATIGVDSDLLIGHLDKLIATGVLKLLLNLAEMTQLDSSAISAIVGTYVSLRAKGGDLKLLCPCGRVLEVLRTLQDAQAPGYVFPDNSQDRGHPTQPLGRKVAS